MEKFNTIMKDGDVIQYKYQQISPYLLYIETDIADNELILEFTGKLLGARYSELINQNNIRQCLENINTLGICMLDIDAILDKGKVVKADVTIDTEYHDMPALTKELQSCIKNNGRYTAVNKRGNFVVEKNVKTKNRKIRLTIYDKEQEMNLQENKRWMQTLSRDAVQHLQDYFRHRIRFELNLNSIQAIQKMLQVSNNELSTVLGAEANPIMSFLDTILVDNTQTRAVHTLHDAERMAFLQMNNFDMKAVENDIRKYKSPNTNIHQVMKPYRELYMAHNEYETTSIKERLKNILLEFFLIGFFVLF